MSANLGYFIGPDIARALPALSSGKASALLRQELVSVRLVAEEDLDTSVLEREFPTVAVESARGCGPGELIVDDYAWRGSFDFCPFDEAVENVRPSSITVRGDDAAGVACELMGRYQRLVGRRNAASKTALFDAVLEAHAVLHDPALTLVKGDLDHALDTWQWMLRLDADASLHAQLAAIFHDIDRLESEPRERIEHRAVDPASGKDAQAHATRGGDRAFAILCEAGVSQEDAARVRAIVAHDRTDDGEIRLLDDADALSFLSLSSSVYADHFGLAQTRRKVGFTIARLGARAREKLGLVRLRPDVERLLHGLAA